MEKWVKLLGVMPNMIEMLLTTRNTGMCIRQIVNDRLPNQTIGFWCRNLEKAPLLLSDIEKKKIKEGMTNQNNEAVLMR